jgi:fatty acid desaturase
MSKNIHRPKLTAEEHARLHARSELRPALHVALVFVGTAIVLVVHALHPSIAMYAISVLLVAACQHHLSIVQHEANHYLLFTNRTVNEVIGTVAAASIGFTMDYRRIHFEHHRALGHGTDPDLPNYEAYPKWPGSFLLDLAKNLSGYAAGKQLLVQTLARDSGSTPAKRRIAGVLWVLVAQACIFCAFAATGRWFDYFLVWILPLVTVAKTLAQFRNIAEHTLVTDKGEVDLSRYRTIRCGWLEQFFFAPMFFNYHAEHHFFPGIPYFNLPMAHRILREKAAYLELVDVDHGYIRFLLTKAIRKSEPTTDLAPRA